MSMTVMTLGEIAKNVAMLPNYPDGITDWSFLDDKPEMIHGEATQCGHDVKTSILDEMEITDYSYARCHHCEYYAGRIDHVLFEKLCEMENRNE